MQNGNRNQITVENTIVEMNNATIEKQVWLILESVIDPEIPVLSVTDLGLVRAVTINDAATGPGEHMVMITLTPTYTGCPAMDMIRTNIRLALLQAGFSNVEIKQTLAPAWTTDWMSEKGKEKLKAYGIAPPIGRSFETKQITDIQVTCPRCGSANTKLVSAFGSTACKAFFQCIDCKEPFDYFKCH